MKRHRFDPFSFVFGALFMVVGATFLFGGSGLTAARPVRMWPAATIVVGVSLAAWAVGRAVHRETTPVAVEVIPVEGGGLVEAAKDATAVPIDDRPEEQRPV
ncbi:MAG: hypothetical protein ACRDH7_00840 [Actinomycetota bacterium]